LTTLDYLHGSVPEALKEFPHFGNSQSSGGPKKHLMPVCTCLKRLYPQKIMCRKILCVGKLKSAKSLKKNTYFDVLIWKKNLILNLKKNWPYVTIL